MLPKASITNFEPLVSKEYFSPFDVAIVPTNWFTSFFTSPAGFIIEMRHYARSYNFVILQKETLNFKMNYLIQILSLATRKNLVPHLILGLSVL